MAGKRAGLGANPLDWIKDTTEKTEPEESPKRKPRVKKKHTTTSKSSEVQELQPVEVQENEAGERQDAETLELEQMVTQEDVGAKPVDRVLKADPIYREYEEAKAHVPKYQQLEVKLYVLLREDQLESLSRLTRQIMKNRASEYKKERITKNTIIRALVDNLNNLEVDVQNVADESELAERISDAIKQRCND